MLVAMLIQVPLGASQGNQYCKRDRTQQQTIVEIASGDERFEILVAALQAAGLVDTLQGEGPFTVFAPTNDAFGKLPAGTVETLLQPENKDQLVDILTYHVFADALTAKEVIKLDGKEIKMVNGKTAKIKVEDGSVFINDAKVVITDIKAKNGIIHVIDLVLIP